MVLMMVMTSFRAEGNPISSDELDQKWQKFKLKFGNMNTLSGNTHTTNKINALILSDNFFCDFYRDSKEQQLKVALEAANGMQC